MESLKIVRQAEFMEGMLYAVSKYTLPGHGIQYTGQSRLVFHHDFDVTVFDSLSEFKPFCDSLGVPAESAIRVAGADCLDVLLFVSMGDVRVLTERSLASFGSWNAAREKPEVLIARVLSKHSLEIVFGVDAVSFLAWVNLPGKMAIQHFTLCMSSFKVVDAVELESQPRGLIW